MKFSYNWIREFVDGLDVPARSARAADHDEDRRVRRRRDSGRAAGRGGRGHVSKRRADRRQPQREGAWSTRAATAGRPWSAARRIAAPGITTVYVPLGIKTISGVESDGMLASAAELGINRDHAGIIELRDGAGYCLSPTASSRSTTRASRTGPISGATTAWRAKSPRSPARRCAIRCRLRRCCPAAGGAGARSRSKICDLCPRYSALVFRERDRAALAAVAAGPADRRRAESDQQHRRPDELHHGGTGAADARVRSRQAARRHDLGASGARRASASSR